MDLCIPKVVILLYSKGKVSPLAGLSFLRTSFVEGDRETGGERGRGGGRRGAGSGIPKLAGSGRNGGNYATLRNISYPKKRKEAGASKCRARGNRD